MAGEFTNAGTTLSVITSGSTYTVLGGLKKLDPPMISKDTIEVITHNVLYNRNISSNVLKLGEMKATIVVDSGSAVSTMRGYVVSGSSLMYKITEPNNATTTFHAICKSFAPPTADIEKPEELKTELVFACDGDVTFA